MIEAPQVAAAIRRVVDSVGEDHFDGPPFEYVDADEKPKCLTAHVLASLGAYLPDHDHRLNGRKVATLVLEAMTPVDLEALDLLVRLQALNDEGVPWGEIRDELTDQQDELKVIR